MGLCGGFGSGLKGFPGEGNDRNRESLSPQRPFELREFVLGMCICDHSFKFSRLQLPELH
jgi:hypothetical protein